MSKINVGTCSWTDKTLLESGQFYPKLTMSAEERLRFYAENFSTVEVDSSYYALPSENVVGLQVARTPEDFTLHYKAFGLLTQHNIDGRKLPKVMKEALGTRLANSSRIHFRDVPQDVLDLGFQMFHSALAPAHTAGKLGVVLFQFPPWFHRSNDRFEYIESLRDRMPGYEIAIEFRDSTWFGNGASRETLRFLENHRLHYVSVDEPQLDDKSTAPPIHAATSHISYVRMHGRNKENWRKSGISVSERFAYRYEDDELSQWATKAEDLARDSHEVFVMFNNCYADFAVSNAKDMQRILDARTPGGISRGLPRG